MLFLACATCVALAALRASGARVPSFLLLGAGLLVLTVIGVGVAFHGSGVFARPLQAVLTSRPVVAITIDDGPDPAWTPALLQVLEARGHLATFFVIGDRAERHPQLLRQIAESGHEVENHSLRHSYATPFAKVSRLAQELRRTSAVIEAATGRPPRWFRPPVGLISPRVAGAARAAGLELMGWSATARDGVDFTSAEESISRLSKGLAPGAVLVIHDARPGGPALLSRLLDLLDARKLRSVTLDQLVHGGE
jgi:peptidoglycan/xylan/chitin deacetylase (PgdA/CDA1 family)